MIVKLVWVVIPLVLIVTMIGIIGVQESFADSYEEAPGIFVSDNNVDYLDYEIDEHNPAVRLFVDAKNTSTITITIPKNIWYSTDNDCNPDKIFVVIDGQEVKYDEDYVVPDASEYVFEIQIPKNTKLIEFVNGHIDNSSHLDYGKQCWQDYKISLTSPLKQIKLGVPIDEITCKENFVLIQKHDGPLACVKPLTAEKLIQRGWSINEKITDSLKIPNAERDAKLAAGYKLYPGVGWVHPDDQGNQQPIYRDNPNNPGELILDLDAMLLLQKIMDSCKNLNNEINVRPDMVWSNTTHFINNDVCEWTNTISTQCESVHGGWIDEYNECVPREFPLESCRDGLCQERFENFCSEFNGDYSSCHSGCRHSPDWPNVVCAAVCEKVCEFE